jgi:hypothetical protein
MDFQTAIFQYVGMEKDNTEGGEQVTVPQA